MVDGNEEDIPDFYRADSRARRQALANRPIIRKCREYAERVYQARSLSRKGTEVYWEMPEFVACLLPELESAYCNAGMSHMCHACSCSMHHCPLSVTKQLYAIGCEFESARLLLWDAGLDHTGNNYISNIVGAEGEFGPERVPVLRQSKGHLAYMTPLLEGEELNGRIVDEVEGTLENMGTLRQWFGIPDYNIDTLTLTKDLVKEVWYFLSMYYYLVPWPDYDPEAFRVRVPNTPEMASIRARIHVLSDIHLRDSDSNWDCSKPSEPVLFASPEHRNNYILFGINASDKERHELLVDSIKNGRSWPRSD